MNSTMAPTALVGLNRRNELKVLYGRQSFGRGGGKRGNGDNGGDDGGNEGNGKNGNNGKGNVQQKDHDNDSPPPSPGLPQPILATSTSVGRLTSTTVMTIATTVPTTVNFKATIVAPSSSSSFPSISAASFSIPSSSTSVSSSRFTVSTTPETLVSSSFAISATTTIALPLMTPFNPSVDPSNPRKGLEPDNDESHSATKTKNHHSTVTMLSDTAPSATASSTLVLPPPPEPHHEGGLSLTGEHVLIAFGAIGAFIMFLAVIYFVARMKKIDLFAKARGRGFSKGGPRGWYGWRDKEMDYSTDGPPPKYTGYKEGFEYPSAHKAVPTQHHLEAFHSPITAPAFASPESAAAMSRGIVPQQRRDTGHEALLDNPAPFGVLQAQPNEHSATQSPFYRQPTYGPAAATFNPTYNSNAASAGISRQNPDANDEAQRDPKYMSYLSSLSSGFGDQIIIPEPMTSKPVNVRASRQSYRQSRKFSWANSAQGPHGDRDTVYTNVSIDSTPPRFRTISSWVSQQTSNVERQRQAQDELSTMPEMPKPLRIGGVAMAHHRNPSEDPAFRHHPGDEVEFSKGTRIPSTILDNL